MQILGQISKPFLLVVLLCAFPNAVDSFVPNSLYSVYGWLGSHHEEISVCAINKIAVQFLNKITTGVESKALTGCTSSTQVKNSCKSFGLSCREYDQVQKTVTDANALVDKKEGHIPTSHFDAETFYDTNRELITIKQAALRAMLESEDYVTARQKVGRVMHTLQDYYSHTNWVELGKTRPNTAIGRHNDLGNLALPYERTCEDCEKMGKVTFCIPFTDTCTDVQIMPTGCFKIPLIEYEFCSAVYRCYNNLITTKITSGYFGGQIIPKPGQSGKCSHGGMLDSTSQVSGSGGINKDTNSQLLSPHHYYHEQAVELAQDATYDLLRDVWDQVGDAHFGRFLGITGGFGSLVIVMDTTGSMSEEIGAAKETAKILADEMNNYNDPPVNYILSPFNDPKVGPLYINDSVTLFKKEIDKLYAGIYGDGGDFPEMCMSGILAALQVCEYNSKIFVFTDADAKDIGLGTQVLSLATEKKAEINFLLTDIPIATKKMVMEQADQAPTKTTRAIGEASKQLYQSTAASTGGQVVSTTNNEIAEVSLSLINAEELLKSTVNLLQVTSSAPAGNTATYKFTADDRTEEFSVEASAVSGVLTSLSVNAVDGSLPKLNMTMATDLSTVKIIKIYLPPAGDYQVTIQTKNSFSLKVTGTSDFEIRALLGTIKLDGHPGFFSIESEPVASTEISTIAEIMGDQKKEVFINQALLVNDLWQVLATLELSQIGEGQFSSKLSVPNSPFRILVKGNYSNENGSVISFQRLQQNIFTPAYVEVVPENNGNGNFIQINNYLTLNFSITNFGSKATFALAATDTLKLIKSATPSGSVILGSNETVSFRVTLFAAIGTTVGAVTTLTVSAETTSKSKNYATTSLIIMPEFIDVMSPTIEEASTEWSLSCADVTLSTCSHHSWQLALYFNDSDTGLAKILARNEITGPIGLNCTEHCDTHHAIFMYSQFDEGFNNGSVFGYLEASCCVNYVEIVATDVAGNLNLRVLEFQVPPDSGLDVGAIIGIVCGAIAVLVIIGIVIAAIVFKTHNKAKTEASKPKDVEIVTKHDIEMYGNVEASNEPDK